MDQSGMFGIRADLYDRIYADKDYAGEAERIGSLLAAEGVEDGARLLEAACGTGRHLAALRSRYAVAGFDLSASLLAIARERLPGVPLWQADMRDLAADQPFDALLCLFSSIGYLDLAGLGQAAARFAAALRPGGVLIVEPWLTPADFRRGEVAMRTYESPDLKLARAMASSLRGRWSVLEFRWMIAQRDREVERLTERHELLLATDEEVGAALAAAGFQARKEPESLAPGRGLWIGRKIS